MDIFKNKNNEGFFVEDGGEEDNSYLTEDENVNKLFTKINDRLKMNKDLSNCSAFQQFIEGGHLDAVKIELTEEILNSLNNDTSCFKKTLSKYRPTLEKELDNLEIKNNNIKKNIFSRLIDIDIRIDYYKSLKNDTDKITKAENERTIDGTEDTSNVLTYDEKNNINKRLATFYNKNLEILNIIYKILYYIYLFLFLVYFIFCIFNLYMSIINKKNRNYNNYTYSNNSKIDYFNKFKFSLIGTILIIILPIFLHYILNKNIFLTTF